MNESTTSKIQDAVERHLPAELHERYKAICIERVNDSIIYRDIDLDSDIDPDFIDMMAETEAHFAIREAKALADAGNQEEALWALS